MPVHFDWWSLQQYTLPALEIVPLLILPTIAAVIRLGLGSSPSDKAVGVPDANVIFNQGCRPAWDVACLPIDSRNEST